MPVLNKLSLPKSLLQIGWLVRVNGIKAFP